jgi:CPA2 family monovalent cation:H+ antiporter-2
MIVGQSEFSFRAASDALPMRDAFAVLFFVSIGMPLDPRALMMSPALLLATLAIVMLGKPLVAFFIARSFGYASKVAVGVSFALAQIGEFSLVLATVGTQLNILPAEAANLIIAASLVSLTVNPVLYRSTRWVGAKLARFPGIGQPVSPPKEAGGPVEQPPGIVSEYRAVVVGYGPVGRTLARLLREGGIEPVIIEMNLENSRRVRDEGYAAVYGDATQPEILEAAGIRTAIAVVVVGPPSDQGAEIIRIARSLNPQVRVLARSYYLRETEVMRRAGADEVFSGEGEVALAMTEYVLGILGATPEQMDRERQRVREEVFRIGRAAR